MDPDFNTTSHRVYKVREFSSLHDRELIKAVYAAILGRKPDPDGERHYLSRLRSGASRENVINQIANSAEAKHNNVAVKGLRRALFVEKIMDLPFLGTLLSLIFFVFSAKTRFREMRALRNKVYGLENELSYYQETILRQQQLIASLKERVETNYLDRENLVQSVPAALRKLTRDINEMRSRLEGSRHG